MISYLVKLTGLLVRDVVVMSETNGHIQRNYVTQTYISLTGYKQRKQLYWQRCLPTYMTEWKYKHSNNIVDDALCVKSHLAVDRVIPFAFHITPSKFTR